MSLRLIILLCTLLVACGGKVSDTSDIMLQYPYVATAKGTVNVLIDYRFTETEMKAVYSAVSRWNTALGNNFQFKVVSDDYDMWPENLYNGDILILRQPRCDAGQGGWVDEIPGHFAHICPGMPDSIVAHEMGHLIGLTHIDDKPNSLMNGTVGNDNCIDIPTLVQLYALHPDWTDLKYECP